MRVKPSIEPPEYRQLQTTILTYGYEANLSWCTQSSSPPDTNVAHYPRLMYYYHPDYLGHVEYITDLDGVPYQYFYYTPWGEALVEQKNTLPGMVFDSPYRFNGKELDEEPTERSSRTPSKNKTSREQTGLYYYGARYYNPTVSVWLGVDPKAHWYPTMSSYVYTANNPIIYVDPNGQWVEGGGFWNNLFLSDSRVVEKMAKKHAKKIGGEVIPIDGGFRVTGPETTNGNVNNSNLGEVGFTDFDVDRLSGSANSGGGWTSTANNIITGIGVGTGIFGGNYGLTANQTFKYGQRINGRVISAAEITAAHTGHSLKVARALGRVNVVTGVIGTGVSINNVVTDYQQGGWNQVNGLDVSDALVGSAGVGVSIGAAIGIISNPVGWGIGIGIGIYFGARLIYDLSTKP